MSSAESKVRFVTSKGSQYTVLGITRTKRLKSYHPEHGAKDQGEKTPSDLTVYLDESGFTKFAEQAALSGPDAQLPILGQRGMGMLEYWSSKGWKQVFLGVSYSLIPRIGYYPLELWGWSTATDADGKAFYTFPDGWHIGNKIVNMEIKR